MLFRSKINNKKIKYIYTHTHVHLTNSLLKAEGLVAKLTPSNAQSF